MGDSSRVLSGFGEDVDPDLVFHDGEHSYSTVATDIQLTKSLSEDLPLQVFDDCYLFEYIWEYRPFMSQIWIKIEKMLPTSAVFPQLRSFSLSKTRFPGVTQAVKEEIKSNSYQSAGVIKTPDPEERGKYYPPVTMLKEGP
jgi:hypothetical protein